MRCYAGRILGTAAVDWLRHAVGPSAVVCVGPIGHASAASLPEVERVALTSAVPKRVREFVCGREQARLALRELGLGGEIKIPRGPHGAPLWPRGYVGSIAHDAHTAVAVVARVEDARAIGVDIEGAEPLGENLWSVVLTHKDRATIACSDLAAGDAAKRIFSAKEAAYKAQFPRSGIAFGFDALSIAFATGGDGFTAHFEVDASPFRRGDILAGSVARFDDTLLSAVVLDPAS